MIIVKVAVSTLLIYSGLRKIQNVTSIHATLLALGLGEKSGSAAILLVALEILVAVGILVAEPWRALWASLTLLLGFLFALSGAIVFLRGVKVRCACFGNQSHELGWIQVAVMPAWLIAAYIFMTSSSHWSIVQGFVVLGIELAAIIVVDMVRVLTATKDALADRYAVDGGVWQ